VGFAFGIVLVLLGCELPVDSCGGEPYCGPPPIDSSCAGEGQGYCAGDVRVECYADGSSSYEDDCGAEPTPRTCVEGDFGIPFCAVSDQHEERCQGDPWPGFCDAGVLTRCREGFVEEVSACPGGACIEHAGRRNFCALSTERDPRCPSAGAGTGFCDGGWVIECVDGYASLRFDCGNRPCTSAGDSAYCT
jgi:hypothetical protein